jgi:hypothetical protein
LVASTKSGHRIQDYYLTQPAQNLTRDPPTTSQQDKAVPPQSHHLQKVWRN